MKQNKKIRPGNDCVDSYNDQHNDEISKGNNGITNCTAKNDTDFCKLSVSTSQFHQGSTGQLKPGLLQPVI